MQAGCISNSLHLGAVPSGNAMPARAIVIRGSVPKSSECIVGRSENGGQSSSEIRLGEAGRVSNRFQLAGITALIEYGLPR
jgi:hypothetical protein